MVEIRFSKEFTFIFSKLDSFMKQKLIKQVKKISEKPKVGKPMRNVRKGTRELYLKPFRLSYEYIEKIDCIYILDLYHKRKQ